MGRTAAAPDGAAAAVEQQQFDAVLATDLHQLFLGGTGPRPPWYRRPSLNRSSQSSLPGAMQALAIARQESRRSMVGAALFRSSRVSNSGTTRIGRCRPAS